jgi:hypothetical protein
MISSSEIESEQPVADAVFAVGLDFVDRNQLMTMAGSHQIYVDGGQAQMQETIGFEGKLHGVGAHISGLDDANTRNRNPFGVSLTTH